MISKTSWNIPVINEFMLILDLKVQYLVYFRFIDRIYREAVTLKKL